MPDAYSATNFAATPGLDHVHPLSELADANETSAEERRLIVEQVATVLDELYVHLPLKRVTHGIDPVGRLRALATRLDAAALPGGDDVPEAPPMSERQFHAEMIAVITSLRDLHTLYLAPDPYRHLVAFLPVMVEECTDGAGARNYLVTKVAPEAGALGPGGGPVELTHWNGIPIDRAVEREADRTAGANPEARHARSLDRLTCRWLGAAAVPDEDWVVLSFKDAAGRRHDARCPWLVAMPERARDRPAAGERRATSMGQDSGSEMVRRVKKALFGARANGAPKAGERWASRYPDALTFGPLPGEDGPFGYLRVWTFDVDLERFTEEARRMLEALPPGGVVIDLRGNPGGLMEAGDALLEMLAPGPVELEPLEFIATPLTLALADALAAEEPRRVYDIEATRDSLRTALRTAAGFSRARPVGESPQSSDAGQAYQGPKVLIVDPLCYSTTELFAAGFQDHAVGELLGTAGRTGGGGGNPWQYELLQQRLGARRLRRLPAGAPAPDGGRPGRVSLTVTIRRALRVGAAAGALLEGTGVEPGHHHAMTRDDVLHGNRDLLAAAVEVVADPVLSPRFGLEAVWEAAGPAWRLAPESLARVEVWVDDRPERSVAVTGRAKRVPDPGGPVLLRGYDADGRLRVACAPQRIPAR